MVMIGGDVRWADLAADRARLDRVGTVERVADVLREHILEGSFPPGTRLSEESIGSALSVSRNTLREAFRLLCHERLAVHQFNRGVFVRELSVEDMHDLYRMRRLIEGGAVRELPHAAPGVLADIAAAVDSGHSAARAGNWRQVGTADLRFHQAITAITGSPRIMDVMHRVLAELRLVFAIMPEPRIFHEPYLDRNASIYQLLAGGDTAGGEAELDRYLRDAEQQLTSAFDRTSASMQASH